MRAHPRGHVVLPAADKSRRTRVRHSLVDGAELLAGAGFGMWTARRHSFPARMPRVAWGTSPLGFLPAEGVTSRRKNSPAKDVVFRPRNLPVRDVGFAPQGFPLPGMSFSADNSTLAMSMSRRGGSGVLKGRRIPGGTRNHDCRGAEGNQGG